MCNITQKVGNTFRLTGNSDLLLVSKKDILDKIARNDIKDADVSKIKLEAHDTSGDALQLEKFIIKNLPILGINRRRFGVEVIPRSLIIAVIKLLELEHPTMRYTPSYNDIVVRIQGLCDSYFLVRTCSDFLNTIPISKQQAVNNLRAICSSKIQGSEWFVNGGTAKEVLRRGALMTGDYARNEAEIMSPKANPFSGYYLKQSQRAQLLTQINFLSKVYDQLIDKLTDGNHTAIMFACNNISLAMTKLNNAKNEVDRINDTDIFEEDAFFNISIQVYTESGQVTMPLEGFVAHTLSNCGDVTKEWVKNGRLSKSAKNNLKMVELKLQQDTLNADDHFNTEIINLAGGATLVRQRTRALAGGVTPSSEARKIKTKNNMELATQHGVNYKSLVNARINTLTYADNAQEKTTSSLQCGSVHTPEAAKQFVDIMINKLDAGTSGVIVVKSLVDGGLSPLGESEIYSKHVSLIREALKKANEERELLGYEEIKLITLNLATNSKWNPLASNVSENRRQLYELQSILAEKSRILEKGSLTQLRYKFVQEGINRMLNSGSRFQGSDGLEMNTLINLAAILLGINSNSTLCKSGKDRTTVAGLDSEKGFVNLMQLSKEDLNRLAWHDFYRNHSSQERNNIQQIVAHNEMQEITATNNRQAISGNKNITAIEENLSSVGFEQHSLFTGLSHRAKS